MNWFVFVFSLLFILPGSSLGSTFTAQQITELAESPEWLAMVYYKKSLSGRLQSEVDDDRFFLAADGKTSPVHELRATLEAFRDGTPSNPPMHCRFPARFKWLDSKLGHSLPSSAPCPNLDKWKRQINAESVTLVFPSAYLDSPSSMFGHTLLRFDQTGQNSKNEILAYTVNFAATKKPEDSELGFVYRGLVGGYPGDITLFPYYLKLKEYKDMESRDIWEYKLNLNQEETDQLLNVIWELKDKRIDYYFFTENCAYRIASFLNTIRPKHGITKHFHFSAIPLDTIRQIKDAGFVSDIQFRPSIRTSFDHDLNQLSPEEQSLIKKWVTGKLLIEPGQISSNKSGAAAVLDTAFAYSRMSTHPSVNQRELSFQILKARKEVKERSSLKPVPRPKLSDEFGHQSRKLTSSLGVKNRNRYVGLSLRAAYHDLMDPPLGYPRGASLIFGEMELRYYESHEARIEQAKLISITSLKPRTDFFKPLSWMVEAGGRRVHHLGSWPFAGNVKGLLGPTYPIGNSWLIHFMSGADIRFTKTFADFVKPYSYSELGLTGRMHSSQWQVKLISELSLTGRLDKHHSAEFGLTYNLNQNATINFTASNHYHNHQESRSGALSFALFY